MTFKYPNLVSAILAIIRIYGPLTEREIRHEVFHFRTEFRITAYTVQLALERLVGLRLARWDHGLWKAEPSLTHVALVS